MISNNVGVFLRKIITMKMLNCCWWLIEKNLNTIYKILLEESTFRKVLRHFSANVTSAIKYLKYIN